MSATPPFQNRWWIPVASCLGIRVGVASALLPFFFVLLVTAGLRTMLGDDAYPQRKPAPA